MSVFSISKISLLRSLPLSWFTAVKNCCFVTKVAIHSKWQKCFASNIVYEKTSSQFKIWSTDWANCNFILTLSQHSGRSSIKLFSRFENKAVTESKKAVTESRKEVNARRRLLNLKTKRLNCCIMLFGFDLHNLLPVVSNNKLRSVLREKRLLAIRLLALQVSHVDLLVTFWYLVLYIDTPIYSKNAKPF
jgi:hypothetical protein